MFFKSLKIVESFTCFDSSSGGVEVLGGKINIGSHRVSDCGLTGHSCNQRTQVMKLRIVKGESVDIEEKNSKKA